MGFGKVYLVGAGPGDPELLTLRALKLLQQADVLLYDRLVSPEIRALAHPEAKLIPCGKGPGEQEEVQQWIFEQMLLHSTEGKLVVRLKSGDPCVFGRGGDEWLFLTQHGIEVEMVPGLSSSIAAATSCGIPLTHRNLSRAFTVVTGHRKGEEPTEWSRYAAIDTLVVLMGVGERASIASALIDAGRPAFEPVAFIERATTHRERVLTATLEEVARGEVEVEAPAVFVIGWVVALRDQLIPQVAQLQETAVLAASSGDLR
ncbi:MAG TPA: uroporphyrinogen-III C-methyltransferase [Terriglobales bacterium]|nr:uroporphyrinogen-III C-methyltransferase [Terriglobales bacterium]